MAVTILWAPGKMRSFCGKKTHVHKIPPFMGGVGGGECRFYFYGREDFSDSRSRSGIEILKPEGKMQASQPPRPFFCVGGGNLKVEIENFTRD